MTANPLSAKLTKLLSSSLDDPKLRTSLTTLSEFYSVNAVNSRHNLRGDIERRGTEVNYQFLKELEKVNKVPMFKMKQRAPWSNIHWMKHNDEFAVILLSKNSNSWNSSLR